MLSRRLAGAGVLVALLAACVSPAPLPRPSPAYSGPLRVRLPAAARTLDPALAATPSELAILGQLVEPLLKPTADLREVVPAAAQSYEVSPDGLLYSFHLRAGAAYSDGVPVQAQDFVAGWRRLLDPRVASPYADEFAAAVQGGQAAASLDPKLDVPQLEAALAATGLSAPDDSTFQVRLPRPEGWARWLFTLPQGAPVRPGSSAGNGPFALRSNDRTGAVLDPNPHYPVKPGLQGIRFTVVASDAQAVTAFNSGALDIAPIGLADPGLAHDLVRQPQLTVYWLDLNTSLPPFQNLGLRQALAAAIDRPALVREVLHQRGSPAGSPLPAGLRGGGGAAQAFDAGEARRLLAASGVPAAELGGLKLMVPNAAAERPLADVLVAQLKQNLGLDVAVDAVPPATFGKRLADGDYQLAAPDGWTADYPDVQDFLQLFRSLDGRDHPRWRVEAYDLLERRLEAELDPARRDALAGRLERLLVDGSPAVFLAQSAQWSLVKPYVHGLVTSAADSWPGSGASTGLSLGGG